jgi:hypothetical protein
MGLFNVFPPPGIIVPVRRKVFVSYFRADRPEVEEFVSNWAETQKVFIPQIIGAFGRGIINSTDTEYVIGRIRTEHIADATVTMVLVGSCTHSRRHVDWEIQASLRQGENSPPNGLLGIVLPSQGKWANPPPRFKMNWVPENRGGYARYYVAPRSAEELRSCIEDAFRARTSRASLIKNPREAMTNNARCNVCGVTHSLRVDSKRRGQAWETRQPAFGGSRRCLVIDFNPFSLGRRELQQHLDTLPEILNWCTALPSQVIIVSEQTSYDIGAMIRARFPNQFFTVSGIAGIDGCMTKDFWDFVNNPKSSGRWDATSPLAQLLLAIPLKSPER